MKSPDETPPPGGEVKPFLEHLEDLRRTIIRCALALVIGMIVAIPLAPGSLGLLTVPLERMGGSTDVVLRSLDVGGAFVVTMKIAFWLGLLLSMPFLVVFLAQFVFPGLTEKEKRIVLNAGGVGVILFVLGVVLGYQLTLPTALTIMLGMHGWLGIQAEWTVTSYVAFAMQLLIGFGLVFELPAILLVLGRLGIVSSSQLRHYRRHAVIAALVIGMILTPPDVFSQMLMAGPLIALYEMCVWIVWAWERRAAGAARVGEHE